MGPYDAMDDTELATKIKALDDTALGTRIKQLLPGVYDTFDDTDLGKRVKALPDDQLGQKIKQITTQSQTTQKDVVNPVPPTQDASDVQIREVGQPSFLERVLPQSVLDSAHAVSNFVSGGAPTAIDNTLGGAAPIVKGAVQGLDSMAGAVTRPVGKALELYGQLPEALGVVPEGTGNVFSSAGQTLQSPAASQPIENTLTAGQGFHPAEGAAAVLQHVISSAVGAAAPLALSARLLPLLGAGFELPSNAQIVQAMRLGRNGALTAEAAKTLGAGPWTQFFAELAGGAIEPKQVVQLFQALRERPELRSYLVGSTKTLLNKNAEEVGQFADQAFGGPTLSEQFAGDTSKLDRQKTALQNFVGEQQKSVFEAQQTAQETKQAASIARDRLHVLRSGAIERQFAADDIASAQIDHAQQQVQAIEDKIRQIRNSGAIDAHEQEVALTQQKNAIRDNYQQATRAARDAHLAVQDEIYESNRSIQRNIADVEDQAAKLAEANAKDLDTTLAYAQKNAAKVGVEIAGAGSKQTDTGRELLETGGANIQQFYDVVVKRIKSYLGPQYDALLNSTNITGDVGKLEAIVQKYKPTIEPESVPTAEVAGRYAPKSLIKDFENKIAQIGGENQEVTTIPFKDIHEFRSSLYDEIRRTSYSDPRRRSLQQLAGELEAYIDNIGDGYPDLPQYRKLNDTYRTEIGRVTGGPGYYTRLTNPITGEEIHTPIEDVNHIFGPGPTLERTSAVAAQRANNFRTFLRDVGDVAESARLQGDTTTQDAANGAKTAVFDIIRNHFYQSVMKDGTYVPKLADKWFNDYSSYLAESPELARIFKTPKDRLAALREVEARAQAAQQLPQTYIEALQKELNARTIADRDAVRQSQRATTAATDLATDTRNLDTDILAEDRLALARKKIENSQQTTEELTQAQRKRDQAIRQAREERTQTRRDITREKVQQQDVLYDADKRAKEAADLEAQAVKYYKETFGNSDAAQASLEEELVHEHIGSRPSDIIAQMNDIGSKTPGGDAQRARYFGYFFRKAGGNQHGEVEQALLHEMWRQFLGTDAEGKLNPPDIDKAETFITKNIQFLRDYYPDYYDDITKVHKALTRLQDLRDLSGKLFPGGGSLFSHASVASGAAYALHILGAIPWNAAVGIILGYEVPANILWRRKVAALSQIYLNADNAALVRNHILTQNPTPKVANAAAYSIVLRSGILAREADLANTAP